MSGSKFFRRLVRYALCLTAALLAFAACAYTDYRLWPLDLHAPRSPALPAPEIQVNRLVLPFARGVAAAKVATFHDQLEAFLHYEYLRGREARDGSDTSRILLTAVDTATGPSYEIFIVSDNDLLTAIPHLAQLEGRNLIAHYDLNTWTEKDFAYYRRQSHMLDVAYGLPTEHKLKRIEGFQLVLRGEDIRNGGQVGLPPVVGKVLLRPRIQVVVGDQIAAFQLRKMRDGGEEIVVADNEDFVGRTGGGIDGSQQDTRGVTAVPGLTTAQIFKME